MFAMLTGNLPFTIEPFSVRGLHGKMIKGEINDVPDHLSTGNVDLKSSLNVLFKFAI